MTRAAPPARHVRVRRGRPAGGELLLRLQMLLEEVVVVGGVGLHLPELLLPLLPRHVHVMGMGLADGHVVQCIGEGGAEEEEEGGDGSSSSSGCLPANQPAAMAVISFFWSDVSPSQRALAGEESMVGVVRRGIGGR